LIAKPPKNHQTIVSKKLPAIDHTLMAQGNWLGCSEQLNPSAVPIADHCKVSIELSRREMQFGYNDFSC